MAGGVNLYAYAGNNPVSFDDPFGLCAQVGNCIQGDKGVEDALDHVEARAAMKPWGDPKASRTLADPRASLGAKVLAFIKIGVNTPGSLGGISVVGEFNVASWSGYPRGVPQPGGTLRLVEGAEYSEARSAANAANRALHAGDPALAGQHIHEIQPVKFGGSPTSLANKIPLSPSQHAEVTTWWNRLLRSMRE